MTVPLIPSYAVTIEAGKAWLTHYDHTQKQRIETIRLNPESLGKYVISHSFIYCALPRLESHLNPSGRGNNPSLQTALSHQTHDLLSLFAFVIPAQFTLPSEAGLAEYLNLPTINPFSIIDELLKRFQGELASGDKQKNKSNHRLFALLTHLQEQKWGWAELLLSQFDESEKSLYSTHPLPLQVALGVWDQLAEWQSQYPDQDPSAPYDISKEDVALFLDSLMNQQMANGLKRTTRQAQIEYAQNLISAFQKPQADRAMNLVFAEAGTGIGKTLGYISTGFMWARANQGRVVISTYTRNLQQQIKDELKRAFPEFIPPKKGEKAQEERKFIVRKGRENYLCLMNYEEETALLNDMVNHKTLLSFALTARWIGASEDGDMTAHNFPDWLGNVIDNRLPSRLLDRRGECIHSSCPHYRRCFGEKIMREAKKAPLVIMNHALAMREQMRETSDDEAITTPRHIIFDEGHHLYDAADSAFSYAINGRELYELRQWVQGGGRKRSRARGFLAQIEPVIVGADKEATMRGTIENIIALANEFPEANWQKRLFSSSNGLDTDQDTALFSHHTIMEEALKAIKFYCYEAHLMTDKRYGTNSPYDLEAVIDYDCFLGGFESEDDDDGQPITDKMTDKLPHSLKQSLNLLGRMAEQTQFLSSLLTARLQGDDSLDATDAQRLEQFLRTLRYRLQDPIAIWIKMLKSLFEGPSGELFLWFGVEREAGRDLDCGLYAHYLNPMRPFAKTLLGSVLRPEDKLAANGGKGAEGVDGVVITSATLTTNKPNLSTELATEPMKQRRDWDYADQIFDSPEFHAHIERFSLPSPFDYKGRTKVLIANDLSPQERDKFATALQSLIVTAGGGTLALFTAIERLKSAYALVKPELAKAGLPLYAQHIDKMSTTTLIDLFRAESEASLFGTDATRDGVDVPGRSLRLLVYDRIPWPRPHLLHKARSEYYQKRFDEADIGYRGYYSDQIARMKLRQAYGRLIRSQEDYGVFVVLDKRSPTRLFSDFPEGVEIQRMATHDLIQSCHNFLKAFDG